MTFEGSASGTKTDATVGVATLQLTDTVLVTGGAGFIGSHLVERLLSAGFSVVNLDLLTYAGNLENLASISGHDGYHFVEGDIADRELVAKLLVKHRPRVVINLAAETHVDRSIEDAQTFIRTNVDGVYRLLDCSLAYYRSLDPSDRGGFRFIQMSTDEVYGSIAVGEFTEESGYAPNSPYAATKAAGDHLVRSYGVTFGLPVVIVHASNTYGPRQYPEKLIPHMILSAVAGKPLPVYGRGDNVRDWMYVLDLADGLERVVRHGQSGAVYNFSGCDERTNLDTVQLICSKLDRLRPVSGRYASSIGFVDDRPGHDRRYAMSAAGVRQSLGWMPGTPFDEGLGTTVSWYLANEPWLRSVESRGYRVARLGAAR